MRTKFDVGQRVRGSQGPVSGVVEIRIKSTGVEYLLESGLCESEANLTAAPMFPTIIIPRQSVIGDAMRVQGSSEWVLSNYSGEDIKADGLFIMRLSQ